MLRITRLSIYAAALLFAWIALLSASLPSALQTLVLWSPFIAIVLFGLSLLISLLYGVATFKTVPSEAASLQLDIARAKKELAKRGITS